MDRKTFELLYGIKKKGVKESLADAESSGENDAEIIDGFRERGYIDDDSITEAGEAALLPYKVDNAVIMAAGMSTRFVPISLEKPKGLLEVKGEVLIERQIEQLHDAGIKDIVIVLGYKKEAFFYLEDKYDGIRFIINPEFNTKNNTNTLYLAQKYINNTYICSSDDYFVDNPFEEYVYQSYYAAVKVDQKTDEWYMTPDENFNIASAQKCGDEGYIMLGHVYWNKEFSGSFIKILNDDHEEGRYSGDLWEQIIIDKISELPPMEIKVYPEGSIFEFDSLDELRAFDEKYVNHTNSKILKNIAGYFKCKEEDVLNFEIIKEGLTNTSFVFEVAGKKYVYRHPGDGTEAIISRQHEHKALELGREAGVDPTFIYMNEEEGWKISHYVEGIRVPSYDSFEDSKRILSVLRNLHEKNYSVDWEFKPWEEALKIEEMLRDGEGIADQGFDELKANVGKCYEKTKDDGVTMRFCHCDTYAPNWMLTEDGKTILIDWEYAGNADPGCDTGTYIMDSMWEVDEATKFIKEYCQDSFNDTLLFHHLAYTALLSYYWYVWALYREACGAVMGDSLYNWHVMAKRYSKYLVKEFSL